MNIGGQLALSATFKTLVHFTVEKLPSTFSVLPSLPNHSGTVATQQKRLACHPSIPGLLKTSYNDLLNHISIADASISYSFLMLLPHSLFSLQSLAGYQIINIDYTLCLSPLSLSLFLSIYSRVLSY